MKHLSQVSQFCTLIFGAASCLFLSACFDTGAHVSSLSYSHSVAAGPEAGAAPSPVLPGPNPSPTPDPIRIAAGAASPYTDAAGKLWSADYAFTGGNSLVNSPPVAIAGTTSGPLYNAERVSPNTGNETVSFSYTVNVPNGPYTVNLGFVENFMTASGQRQFGVQINSESVLSHFDIFAAAGAMNTVVFQSIPVTVSAGVLQISFLSEIQHPKVNSIEVLSGFAPVSQTARPIRVSAGTTVEFVDSSNRRWSADNGYSGGVAAYSGSAIAGTDAQAIYQNERYGTDGVGLPASFNYLFHVPNGHYQVNLGFSENAMGAPGQRQFNVSAGGQQVLTNFDIIAAAGAAHTAVNRSFNFEVIDGRLPISFDPGLVQNPKIDTIEILPLP